MSEKTIFLMGDSMVEDYGKEKLPICGWGKYFPEFVKKGVRVKNYSHSGWTTKTFLRPGQIKEYDGKSCWDVLIEDIKKGDWLIIALGVNDASLVNENRTSEEEYRKNLTYFTEQVRKKGADLVFATLAIRGGDDGSENGWNYKLPEPDNKEPEMDERWMRRTKVLRDIANALNVVLLEQGEALKKIYENMYLEYRKSHPKATIAEGRNYVRYYFHLYNKHINTPESDGGLGFNMPEREDDSTHLNMHGAYVYAKNIAEIILNTSTELSKLIKL